MEVAHDFLAGTFKGNLGRFFGTRPPFQGDAESMKIALLPGNHDRFSNGLCYPGSSVFESKFGDTWDFGSSLIVKTGRHVGYFCLEKDGECLVMCLADFSLQSSRFDVRENFGCGLVTDQALSELAELTEYVRNEVPNCLLLWAMHFPPSYPTIVRELRLIDDHKVLDLAHRENVPLILAGHVHRQDRYVPKGYSKTRVLMAGTPTAMNDDAGHTFSEYTISVRAGDPPMLTIEDYRWDSNEDTWKSQSITTIPLV